MVRQADRRNGYPLPDTVEPPDMVCLKVWVPDEPTYRTNVLGALWELGKWFRHERDELKRAREVAQVWRTALMMMEWGDCVSDPCCPEQIELTRVANEQAAADARRQLFTDWRGLPPGTNPAYVPTQFSSGTPESEGALCRVIAEFISSWGNITFHNLLALGLVSAAGAAAGWLLFPPAGFAAGIIAGVQLWATAELGEALNNEQAVQKVKCCLYDALKGSQVDAATLQAAASACQAELTGDAAIITGALAGTFGLQDNYRIFAEALAAGQGDQTATDDGCKCCDEIVVVGEGGTVVTPLPDNVYAFTSQENYQGQMVIRIRIEGDCCGCFTQAGDPYPPVSLSVSDVIDCTGTQSSFVGGITPGTYRWVGVRGGEFPPGSTMHFRIVANDGEGQPC